MIVAGTDPGKSGAIVAVNTKSIEAYSFKLEYCKAGYLRVQLLMDFLSHARVDAIVMEKVQGFKGSGATQTFNFGFACGEVNAAMSLYASLNSAIQLYVRPQAWQKVMHAGTNEKVTAKVKSHIVYGRLFPHGPFPRGPKGGKVDDNLIDALLLATYGALKLASSEIRPWQVVPWTE